MAAKNRRTFELRLGKLGLILFIGGVSLLLFAMFLLGILVGKQMEAYPDRYSNGMAELVYERLFGSAPQGRKTPLSAESLAKGGSASGEEDFDLTFYDTLAGKKEATPTGKKADAVKNSSPLSPAPSAAPAGKPAVPAPSVPSGGGPIGNSDLPGSGREGADAKKTSPLPERGAAAATGAKELAATQVGTAPDRGGATQETEATFEKGRFEVQVAAYRDIRSAEQMMKKLNPLGFTSRAVMKELPGKGRWFRVIIGGFENREKANAAADQIAGKIRGVKCVVRSSSPPPPRPSP